MKIDYKNILKKNMINVLKEVLLNIEKNGIQEGHHLYITFDTNNINTNIPSWLKNKFPKEMTIVIQYEYWDFKVKKDLFNISLSFDDVKTNLEISYNSVISFADPFANFGLRLIQEELSIKKNESKKTPKKKKINKDNVIDFTNYVKN